MRPEEEIRLAGKLLRHTRAASGVNDRTRALAALYLAAAYARSWAHQTHDREPSHTINGACAGLDIWDTLREVEEGMVSA